MKGWIINAPADLFFFSFGWIPLWIVFIAWGDTHKSLLLPWVLAISFVHRTFTHLFVYGDGETFRERKWAYILLPLFFLLLTAGAILLKKSGPDGKVTSCFLYLAIVSVLWNFYHSVMQKVGILRIYSRKGTSGKPGLDRAVVLSWFVFIFLRLPLIESIRREIASLARTGRVILAALEPWLGVFGALSAIALAVAVVTTAFYIKEELSGRPLNGPKNLFVASILLLYGTFFFGFLPAFVAFGFSHAIEYIAFANHFARRKYSDPAAAPSFMTAFVRRPGFSMALFAGFLIALYLGWNQLSARTLGWFIVGSSFLHYIYDGWIWKLRRPKVAAPLGLAYERAS